MLIGVLATVKRIGVIAVNLIRRRFGGSMEYGQRIDGGGGSNGQRKK